MRAVSIPITILRLPNVESRRRPIMKIFQFYYGVFVLVHARISQCEFWWHGVHVECRAHDLHDFFNVALQTVDVRKARKIVMKSEFVLNTTYKAHIKNVRIFDHENILDWKNYCLIVYLSYDYWHIQLYNEFFGVQHIVFQLRRQNDISLKTRIISCTSASRHRCHRLA